MMTKMEVKDTHSKDLRNLRKWIREELDFRADVGREIESSTAQLDMKDKFPQIREKMEER